MASWIFPKDFLLMYFNRVFSYGRNIIEVRAPLYDLKLFSLDRNFRIRKLISREHFESRRKDMEASRTREFPTWYDFKDCFLTSSALRPRGWSAFLDRIEGIREGARKPSGKVTPVYLAIDTNVAYARIFSRHFPYVKEDSFLEPDDFSYVMSGIIRKEIDNRIRYRYGKEDLSTIFAKVRDKDFLSRLAYRNELATRKAKLAQNEIDFLTKGLGALEITPQDYDFDKEKRDIIIAESYKSFKEENDVEVLLLTFDQNMVNHAKNARLEPFAFEYPRDEDMRNATDPWAIHPLIHDLAIVFGGLRLNPFSAYVFGEWNGKSTEDYEKERVMLQVDDRLPFLKELDREVNISRSLWK